MNISKIEYSDLNIFPDLVDETNNIYYGIFFWNTIFGYIVLKYDIELYIERIYIKKEFRNNGYGSKLLNYSIYENINLKFNKVIVKNHKLINNFLEKNGFIRENDIYSQNNIKSEIEEIKFTLDMSKKNLFINILLATLKIITGLIFNINVLLVDGINSFSDFINNILIIVAANIDKNVADNEHPFGHGRIESIFSLIIGIIIFLSSLNIFRLSIIDIYNLKFSDKFELNMYIIIVSIFTIFIKIIQYIYLKYNLGKKYNQLLKTLILDYYLDIIFSIITFIGIILSKYYNPSIDKFLSIILSFYLIYKAYEVIKENIYILMDSQDEILLLNVKVLTLEIKEIKNIHDIYMTRVGNNIYIMADIRLDSKISLEEAHKISEIAEKKVRYIYPNIKRVIYHIEPIY